MLHETICKDGLSAETPFANISEFGLKHYMHLQRKQKIKFRKN